MLMVQIQRSQYDKELDDIKKNTDPIDVEDVIDLSPFGGKKYKLYAVIMHIGLGNSGHYKIILRDSEDWILASDSVVELSTKTEMLTLTKSRQSPGYLYIYVTNISDIEIIRGKYSNDAQQDLDISMSTSCIFKKYLAKPPSDITQGISDEFYSREVVIQEFNQRTMEYEKPIIFKATSEEVINTFLARYEGHKSYAVDNLEFSSSIPQMWWDTASPLFVLVQKPIYREFKQETLMNMNKIVIYFVIGSIEIDGTFLDTQNIGDMYQFVKTVLKQLTKKKQKFYLAPKYGQGYIPATNMAPSLRSIFQSSPQRIVRVYRSIDWYKPKKINISAYYLGSATPACTASVPLFCPATSFTIRQYMFENAGMDEGAFKHAVLVYLHGGEVQIVEEGVSVPWLWDLEYATVCLYTAVPQIPRQVLFRGTRTLKFIVDIAGIETYGQLRALLAPMVRMPPKALRIMAMASNATGDFLVDVCESEMGFILVLANEFVPKKEKKEIIKVDLDSEIIYVE